MMFVLDTNVVFELRRVRLSKVQRTRRTARGNRFRATIRVQRENVV